MSKDNKSIHEFDLQLICEYFSTIKRQGPGSTATSLKALSFIDQLTDQSRIADIGCGTGTPTMDLARNAPGHITAVDLFPTFIDQLNRNARELNLHDRVEGIVASMDKLPFQEESFDLLWSEGAIYSIGYERGINDWRKYLKTGGYIAVTEASWFTDERPREINEFWTDAYPEIDTIPKKIEQMQKAGYLPVASFVLPEHCWTEEYYLPQVQAQEVFLGKYPGNKTAEELVANQRHEAHLYARYKQFYGYVFYIGKKIS